MPDRRAHRGPHPQDAQLFGPAALPALEGAADDLCWLLGREYPRDAALKLVGDRWRLDKRQRLAVGRASAAPQAIQQRRQRKITHNELAGRSLIVDGYNLLTTIEAALGGGVLLACRDGTFRDMASMHGTYRKVNETSPAIELIGRTTSEDYAAPCCWYLDRPVSNSGRLATMLREAARQHGWPWEVELANNPDRVLIDMAADRSQVAVTADSVVLDSCGNWLNLAREIVEQHVPDAWIVDLSGPAQMG